MSLRVLSFGIVGLVLASLMVSTAHAQPPNFNRAMQQQQQQRMQPIRTVGTLVLAGQNQIQISTNTNQKILVMVGPTAEVSVTGTAEQDYLKSGVSVEFVAEVEKTRTVKEKISHLLVITLTTDQPAGLFPPESATPTKKGEKGNGEKAKPFAPDAGIGDAAPTKGGRKNANPLGNDMFADKPDKAQKKSPQFPGTFTVRGTIKMCKDGKITVLAGHGSTIKAELADDATIDVDLTDFRAAQRDDRVTVDGFASQARPDMVMAKSIKIELANPLSGGKERGRRRGRFARRRKVRGYPKSPPLSLRERGPEFGLPGQPLTSALRV